MASRSAVVMPGRAAALSFSSVRPTTSPAWRMRAISASDLIWITPLLSPQPARLSKGSQRGDGAVGHVVDRAHGVDAHEDARLGVVADQRGRLLVVDLQPVPDRLGHVVVALEQVATADVAGALGRRRVEVDVPDV